MVKFKDIPVAALSMDFVTEYDIIQEQMEGYSQDDWQMSEKDREKKLAAHARLRDEEAGRTGFRWKVMRRLGWKPEEEREGYEPPPVPAAGEAPPPRASEDASEGIDAPGMLSLFSHKMKALKMRGASK